MPRFNLQNEPKRRDVLKQQRQENDFTQQSLDQRQQDSMVGQLAQLYGIANSQEMAPARLEQLGAQTRGLNAGTAQQEFENQWAQPNAEANYGLKQAQTGLAQSAATQKEQLSPNAIPYLVQLGILTPEEASHMVLPPELQAKRVQDAALKEQQRQSAIKQEEAMMGAVPPRPQTPQMPFAPTLGGTPPPKTPLPKTGLRQFLSPFSVPGIGY